MPPNKKEPYIEEALENMDVNTLLENITNIAVCGALTSKILLELLESKGIISREDIECLLGDSDYLESFRKQLFKNKLPWKE